MDMLTTKASLSTPNPVVDFEISNDIAGLKWNYEKAETSVVGFLVDNEITQIMLTDKSKINEFRMAIKDILSTIEGSKLHAFNTRMEFGCFKNLLGYSPKLYEIGPPIKGRGTTKDYFFNYLTRQGKVPSDLKLEDPLNGDGRLCMRYWKEGRFEEVRLHNVCCLIKEAKILEHRNFITEQLGHLVDRNGFLLPGVSLPKI
jgi:hypothetical protein